MNVTNFTKKLVSIPSFVGQGFDEQKIGEFLYKFLKSLKNFAVIKQPVENNRFNIILKDKYPTKLLICAHIDTVQPKGNNALKPRVRGEKLFGLGSTDMKGSLAALICALGKVQKTKGLMLLLYVDEEYDFLGMKKFIDEYRSKINPKLIISADGYNLSIGNGCRGLIEINFQVKGKTAHASKPQNGKNAILGSINAINELKNIIEKYRDNMLGKTSCNLAYIQGGLDLGKGIGREGNNVADIAEFVLDIRPADPKLNAKRVVEIFKSLIEKEGLKLINYKIRHDFGLWMTPKNKLKKVEKITGKNYLGLGSFGFIDTQMLWQVFNKVPSITFGAGNLEMAHKENEYVFIPNLLKAEGKYSALIHSFGGGEEEHGND